MMDTPAKLKRQKSWGLILAYLFLGCIPFGGTQEEAPFHLQIMLTDCSGEGRLRVCVEAEHAVDSPAYKHLPGTFKLTVTGPLRLRGKDTLAADLRLHLDFDKGFRRWDGGDSVILGGGPAVFRACIRDVADSVLCDSVTVR